MFQQARQATLKESLESQIFRFLDKITIVYETYGIQFQFDRMSVINNILNFLGPGPNFQEQQVNNNTLSNFLQSTLNNQAQKKLKKLYCKKKLTEISGSTKLFGTINSALLSKSNIKQSLVSFKSILSSQNYICNISNQQVQSLLTMKKAEPEKSSQLSINPLESDSDYKGISSAQNKRLYKLYSTSTKKQIVQYASRHGYKAACDRYKLPISKIQLWSRSLSKVKRTRGRKPIDPEMQQKVCEWLSRQLQSGVVLTQKIIRQKAKRISGSEEFKASKGWLQKFFKRRPQLFQAYTTNRKNTNQSFQYEDECSHNIVKKENIQEYQYVNQIQNAILKKQQQSN